MYRYTMIVDGENYKALFENHLEGAEFLTDADAELITWDEVTAEDILADTSFETAYAIEMIAKMLIPNASDYHKVSELEAELNKLGYKF